MRTLESWKDKALFTPGPLTTSPSVKQAMLHDMGSRDAAFIETIRTIRAALLDLAGVSGNAYTAVLLQGSGTFGLEAVVNTAVTGGKLLVGVNGAYGRRMVKIAEMAGIPVSTVEVPENEALREDDFAQALAADPAITHVSICHCETTSGVLNPVQAIGHTVYGLSRVFIVDAMSSFGAVPFNQEECHIDYLISSANKCIEGVPGFCFVVARLESLLACEGRSRSLCLDLVDQYRGLEGNGQFRFTPPTHALLAFRQALRELEAEGGPKARGERYRANQTILVEGMRALGFEEYLAPALQSGIITSFLCPEDPKFDFETFYSLLSAEGKVIYPGKVGNADCFRIGTIGRLFASDIRDLLSAIWRIKTEMGFRAGTERARGETHE